MMSCERCRWEISDMVDRRAETAVAAVAEHLEECHECREFSDASYAMRRSLAMATAPNVDGVADAVVRRSGAADRSRHSPVVRWLLVAVAVQIAVLSIPDFWASDVDSHALAHLGAFSLSYAFGLVVVVIRPARARTMFTVSLVLVAALAATALVDIVRGRTLLVSETVHLLELCSAFLLWLLTRPGGGDDRSTHDSGTPDEDPGLRLVPTDER